MLSFDPLPGPGFAATPSALRMFTNSSGSTTVSIDPAASPDVQADLTATNPSILSSLMVNGSDALVSGGDDALTFANGTACDQGAITVNSSADGGSPEVSITESDTDGYTPQGVRAGSVLVTVVQRVARLNGSAAIALIYDGAADRKVEIVDATLAAPGAIPVSLGTASGTSATFSASGDASIADGSRTSTGTILVEASAATAGITTIDVTLGNDFVFQETNNNTITLKTIVLAEPIVYVSGTGSDSTGTGTGTVDNPFRSITFALLATPAVPEVRVRASTTAPTARSSP